MDEVDRSRDPRSRDLGIIYNKRLLIKIVKQKEIK